MASRFIQYFIKHSVITNWVMIIICIAGIFALSNLQKRVNPKFEIEEIEIDVPFPGASALEVEEGIVVKIEESLRGLEGIANFLFYFFYSFNLLFFKIKNKSGLETNL